MAEDDSPRGTLHHLNNLFQVILGSLELLKRNREVSAETVDTALRATQEASLLAQRLLDYERERLGAAAGDPASSSAAASGTGLPKK